VWDEDGAEQVLALEARDAAPVELARGQGLVAQVATDGSHVLVHMEPRPAEHDPWWVFSARTGRRVATLTHDAGAREPAIVGEHAFYLVEPRDDPAGGRTLRARELASDSLTWELRLAARRRSAAPRLRQ
jgi:hypothetical protein